MAAQNQPAFSLRDGAIKLTCWANKGENNKTFHSVDVTRSYKTDDSDDWKETRQFSGSDILKASALMQEAYAKIRELRSESVEAVAS